MPSEPEEERRPDADDPEWTDEMFARSLVGPPWEASAETTVDTLRTSAKALRLQADRLEAEADRIERSEARRHDPARRLEPAAE